MRKGKKFAVALTAALFVSAVPVTAFGAVIKYSPEKTGTVSSSKESKEKDESLLKAVETVKALIETGKMTKEEIKKLGPSYEAALKEYIEEAAQNTVQDLGVAVQEAIEEEKKTGFTGPSVKEVELTQIYHEAYKTYELSMAGQYFLYSNVANGGMTHEPVMIDIPANVTYIMEKDGLPYEYISQQYISEKGTYVMKLMGIENKDAPLSEQKEYQAMFRFRIQDPPLMEETLEAVEEAAKETVNPLWGDTYISTEIPVLAPSEIEKDSDKETKPMEETTDTEIPSDEDLADVPESNVLVEREQDYDRTTGNYTVTLENGKQLTTSVPEGYVGSDSVYLKVSDGDVITTTLYKNDEKIEFVNGESITENGRYRVEMDGYSYFFTLAQEVGQMDYYPAPTGMEFSEVRLDGEAIPLASDQYVEMSEDGIYGFTMKGDSGERIEVTLRKDTTAPEMSVMVNKSTAAIQYLSDDIKTIELVKDGKPVSGFNGTSIAEPGSYTLTIYDGAGNSSSANFSLKYQMNFYAVMAIILVILAIAGIGGFAVYTKKNTKVR